MARSSDLVEVHTPRSIRVTASRRCCPPNISSVTRTMMTRANSLHSREAGSLISLPVTHHHDPRKHPRTGATVMTAAVGSGGRTRRN